MSRPPATRTSWLAGCPSSRTSVPVHGTQPHSAHSSPGPGQRRQPHQRLVHGRRGLVVDEARARGHCLTSLQSRSSSSKLDRATAPWGLRCASSTTPRAARHTTCMVLTATGSALRSWAQHGASTYPARLGTNSGAAVSLRSAAHRTGSPCQARVVPNRGRTDLLGHGLLCRVRA